MFCNKEFCFTIQYSYRLNAIFKEINIFKTFQKDREISGLFAINYDLPYLLHNKKFTFEYWLF